MIDLKTSTSEKAAHHEVPRDMNETLKFISQLKLENIEEIFFATKDSSGLKYALIELIQALYKASGIVTEQHKR